MLQYNYTVYSRFDALSIGIKPVKDINLSNAPNTFSMPENINAFRVLEEDGTRHDAYVCMVLLTYKREQIKRFRP